MEAIESKRVDSTATHTYIADAVALAHYFEDTLPPKANHAFLEAEEGRAQILVPEVVVGEFIYIALKGRLRRDKISDPKAAIIELLEEIESSSYLKQVQMNASSWRFFLSSAVRELHDRMIHSIAMSLASESSPAIITNDPSLSAVFKTVW